MGVMNARPQLAGCRKISESNMSPLSDVPGAREGDIYIYITFHMPRASAPSLLNCLRRTKRLLVVAGLLNFQCKLLDFPRTISKMKYTHKRRRLLAPRIHLR